LAVDFGLPRKEVNLGSTFEGGGMMFGIPLLIGMSIVSFYLLEEKMFICVYLYIIINFITICVYKSAEKV